MKKKVINREKRIICLVFMILLFIGFIAVRGYGVDTDENQLIHIARMHIKEYVRLFFGEGSRIFQFVDSRVENLMDSVDIDHGQALMYPIVAVLSVLRELGRTDLGMYAYHMYLYVWFLIGLLALYGIARYLTGSWRWGACAAALVWLNPLFFGNSFLNNMDITMMNLATISIYTGIRFVEEKSWKWSVLWAVSVAFCTNARMVGIIYGGLFGLLYLAEFLMAREKDRKVFLNGVLAIVVMILVFVAITPASWDSLWGFFAYTLFNSVSFSRWNNWILYCGKFYTFLENPLPWHYVFVFIGITTPPVILLALILGQINAVREIVRFKTGNWMQKKYLFLCFVIVWVPLLFVAVKGANIYGKWRHFYFLYPELVLMAVCGLQWFSGLHKKAGLITKGALAVQGVVCVVLLVSGHPFQSTYFNCLAGRPVADRFEYDSTDYYKIALEKILEMDSGEDICVSSENLVCYYGIKQAWEILSPEKKARIQIAEPETEECEKAKYHVYAESTLRKINLMAESGMEEGQVCAPEEKFSKQLGLDAYGYRIITIYYN